MNLSQEHLRQDLELITRRGGFSRFQRERMLKKARKLEKRGRLSVGTTDPEHLFRLCAAELVHKRFHWQGWHLRSSLSEKFSREGYACETGTIPVWDGRPCRLLVLAEQGVGDEVMCAQVFGELLAENPETVIECDPRLIRPFERTYGPHFISRMGEDGEPRPLEESRGDFDAFVLQADLLPRYRRSLGDFPRDRYLRWDAERFEHWLSVLPSDAYGVAWTGRSGNISPQLGHGTPVNLNYDGTTHPEVMDVEIVDIDDSLALCAALGLVISTTQSIVHFAGAVGAEVHAILPPPTPEHTISMVYAYPMSPWYRALHVYESEAKFNGRA